MFWDIFYKICIEQGTKPNPVAKQIGVSSSTVTSWKNGGIPNGETLLKLADYLNVSVDYLLGRTTEKNISANYGIQNHSDNNQGDITNQLNLQGENGLHGKMLGEFDKLDFKDQVKVLNLIAELSNKEGK
ncbi:MAG: helix-turn-helix transcriptional regulator [Ruminococcus sp.]|nr:helix-turn-helix transcriptional regulator [Ruminococcus sp.]